jgi:hypothetical protein
MGESMTPPSQHPQRYFLISEEELDELVALMEYSRNHYINSDYGMFRLNRVRSRPHAPARNDSDVLDQLEHHIANIQLNYGELSNYYLNNIREKIEQLRQQQGEQR